MSIEQDSVWDDIGYKTEHDPASGPAIQRALGRGPEPEENSHAVPKDENGLYDVDQIKSGMFMPEWGPVKGSAPLPMDLDVDIATHPNRVGSRSVAKFEAARHFAKLRNKEVEARTRLMKVREQTTDPQTIDEWAKYFDNCRQDVQAWVQHAEAMGWKDSQ